MERILVIDDHIETLRLISLILQRHGYQVDTAYSGAKGIEMANANLPDLVLLDIMMPEMSGLDVCRHFRMIPALASVPVVMFTARAQNEDRIEAYKAGADDYIVKPTRPQELVERVKGLLEKHRVDSADLPPPSETIAVCSTVEDEVAHLVTIFGLALAKKFSSVQVIDTTGYANQFTLPSLNITPAAPIGELGAQLKKSGQGGMTLLNLGTCHSSDFTALSSLFHQFILFASAELISISTVRRRIQQLQNNFQQSRLHLVVVEFGQEMSIPSEMISELLQFPVAVAFACPVTSAEAIDLIATQKSLPQIEQAMEQLAEKLLLS